MRPSTVSIEVKKAAATSRLHQVTPLSKYLGIALFITLPFVGAWIGYEYGVNEMSVYSVQNSVQTPVSNDEVDIYDTATSSDSGQSAVEPLDVVVEQDTVFSSENYYIEKYLCINLFSLERECYRLVYQDDKVSFVVLDNLENFFKGTTGDVNLGIGLLSPGISDGNAFFYSFIPHSSGCCRIYRFSLPDMKFIDTDVVMFYGSGDRVSPSGQLVAKSRGDTSLEIIDVISGDVSAFIAVDDNETLASYMCGYAGSVTDFEWVSDTELRYGVYNPNVFTDEDPSLLQCEPEFIEMRTVTVEE